MDAMKVLKALRSKTVERGCSKDEAEQALAMASRLSAKHGIDLKEVDRQLELDGMSRRQRMRVENGLVDLKDFIRRAREEANSKRPVICRHFRRWVVHTVPTAFKCKVCFYASDDWKIYEQAKANAEWTRRRQAEWKAKSKKASRKGTGCSNPFGVHGKGHDRKQEYESVAHYVMSCLKYTDMSLQEIADGSKARFGGKTSKNSVAWYVNKMKKQGEDYARVNAAGDIRRS